MLDGSHTSIQNILELSHPLLIFILEIGEDLIPFNFSLTLH